MSGNHEHNGDHHHVEPRRVLEGRPFPEDILLYRHPTTTNPDRDEWSLEGLRSLRENYGVKRVYVPEEANLSLKSSEPFAVHREPEDRLNPFLESFASPAPALVEVASLLFVPLGLSGSAGLWDELASNDITVNWIGLDPEVREDTPGLRVRALSDWIVRIDDSLPSGAAAGTCTGIVHLRGDLLRRVYESAPHPDWSVLDARLREGSVKLRPNFIHGENWLLPGNSDRTRG